jgi:DNA-directed RNA polymerase specialized sigma24 family protein
MDIVLPHPTLIQALGSPAFKEMVPQLLAYARRRLRRAGWAEGRDHAVCEADATDVLHGMIESCLSGERGWKEGVPLYAFLCNVMRSQVFHRLRRAQRVSYVDDTAEPFAPSSRRDDVIQARRLLAAVEHALAPDPETSELLATMAGGSSERAEKANVPGWTPGRVKAVRAKMNRRLAAAGLRDGEDDEDESRSDGSPRSAAAHRRRAR